MTGKSSPTREAAGAGPAGTARARRPAGQDPARPAGSRGADAARDADSGFRRQATVLKALANETRLAIVHRLAEGECSVGELTSLVSSDRTTVSKHLALLRAHGIIIDRREGNMVFYRLLTPCVSAFFSCATKFLEEKP